MMRKIIAVFLTLTLALALLSGCAKENKPAAESGAGSTAVESTAQVSEDKAVASKTESAAPASKPQISVGLPEGWNKMETAALAQYMNGMASIIVTCDTVPVGVNGTDEYAKYAQEQYKKTFPDSEFADTQDITIDGVEGKDYSFTYSASGMKMKMRTVYLLKGSQAYTISCGTLDGEFDKVAGDFQSMLKSFKIPD
jgi:uncharacterized secreted protein with C-terminal beta-propeller domain